MKAKKENKVYTINTEQEKQRYLKEGYDIYSNEGVLLEHSPLKKISYSKYAELEKENESLKAENEQLKETIEKLRDAAAETDTAAGSKKAGKKAGE